MPHNFLVCLYYSLFSSFLQFGLIVWGLAFDSYIEPIYVLQNEMLRAISFIQIFLDFMIFLTLS